MSLTQKRRGSIPLYSTKQKHPQKCFLRVFFYHFSQLSKFFEFIHIVLFPLLENVFQFWNKKKSKIGNAIGNENGGAFAPPNLYSFSSPRHSCIISRV